MSKLNAGHAEKGNKTVQFEMQLQGKDANRKDEAQCLENRSVRSLSVLASFVLLKFLNLNECFGLCLSKIEGTWILRWKQEIKCFSGLELDEPSEMLKTLQAFFS